MTTQFAFLDRSWLVLFLAIVSTALQISSEEHGRSVVLRRSKRQMPRGYDARQAPDESVITLTLINKSGRLARLYKSGMYGVEVSFQFTLRPNEPRTVRFFPDNSFWSAYDARTQKALLINGQRRLETYYIRRGFHFDAKIHTNTLRPDRYPLGKIAPRYVEVLVIVDPSMIEHYGKNHVEDYVLTLMNVATRAYMARSLAVPIFLAVTAIKMMEVAPSYYVIVEDKPHISVRGGCRYARQFYPEAHQDFSLILTRQNIGPSGFASMYTMCTQRSCGLVQDAGFDSGYVIAHELGHALGIDHDEDDQCKREKRGTNIMAQKLFASSSNYRWSRCSGRMLRQNIKYFPCLKNKPTNAPAFQANMMKLPGHHFNFTSQCQIHHDADSQSCTTPLIKSQCRYLLCTVGPMEKCRPHRWHAPLEGTQCGNKANHLCVRGRCVDRKSLLPVNGNWTAWTDFQPPCDINNNTSAMLMVQSRNRKCANPKPRNGGKKCVGDAVEYRVVIPYGNGVCKPYSLKNVVSRKNNSSFHRRISTILKPEDSNNTSPSMSAKQEFAASHLKHRQSMMFPCSSSNVKGKNWLAYPPYLQSQYLKSVNLSCDFETPGCGWMSSKRGMKPWTLTSGRTPSYDTGPFHDNTLKTKEGKYVFFESSYVEKTKPMNKGDRVILESPLVLLSSICLRFAYHMRGKTMGILEVHVRNGRHGRKMWFKKGEQGDDWKMAEIQLNMNIEYNITIEAIKGASYNSDIGIDDISVTPGSCANGSTIAAECTTMCVDENYTSMLRLQLPNGTPCRNPLHRNNACLKRKCVPVNCEGILGKSDC